MTQPLAGKQILIVEDEPVFRSLMHTWLASLGATIVQAEDGVDALQKMAESKPDLMICDISMPRMNGLQLVEHVRNQGRAVADSDDFSDGKHGGHRQSVASGRSGYSAQTGKRFRSPARNRLCLPLPQYV